MNRETRALIVGLFMVIGSYYSVKSLDKSESGKWEYNLVVIGHTVSSIIGGYLISRSLK